MGAGREFGDGNFSGYFLNHSTLRASSSSADNIVPIWGTTYYTFKLFYPISKPSAHHTTEIKYRSQRNPEQMSVDQKKASSTTVPPTYCPSFKNRFLWFVVTCSLFTPFPVGLIPAMQGGLQAFFGSFWWLIAFFSKKEKTKHLLQKFRLINIYWAPTRACSRHWNWGRMLQVRMPRLDLVLSRGWEEAIGSWCFTGNFKKGPEGYDLLSSPPWLICLLSETHWPVSKWA